MARHTSLSALLDMYREETRQSLNPAHNVQVQQQQLNALQLTQQWLWEDFDWPLLRVYRDIQVQAGQRYYAMPSDITIDRVNKVEFRFNQVWLEVKAGIDAVHFAAYDSDLGFQQWPIRRWRITENEMAEVWPIPDSNFDPVSLEGTLRFTAIKNLSPLVQMTDTADLDDRLIVLFAAAEYLTSNGAKDAQVKMDKANKRYTKLKGGQLSRRKFRMFGPEDADRIKRVPFAVYTKTGP